MTHLYTNHYSRLTTVQSNSVLPKYFIVFLIALVCMLTACSRIAPYQTERDMAADRIVAEMKQINTGLERFKCVGKMNLTGTEWPLQSFRIAMAGKLTTQLRIDMLAPFGGSNGTFSSDGSHLFLVRHDSREYHKKRFGKGNLRRLLNIDINVGDLLELLVGRIPVDGDLFPRMDPGGDANQFIVNFHENSGKIRQRVIIDGAMKPVRSEWFDGNQRLTHALALSGHRNIDGFVLPTRIDLSAVSGGRLKVALDRYEPNAVINVNLFTPTPL